MCDPLLIRLTTLSRVSAQSGARICGAFLRKNRNSGDSRMLVVWISRAVSGSPLRKMQEMEKRNKSSQERA